MLGLAEFDRKVFLSYVRKDSRSLAIHLHTAPAQRMYDVSRCAMTSLRGQHVFLSASFPSGERGERFRPYDAAAVADAVAALVRVIFAMDGSVVFGGHPTITPLVLMIGSQLRLSQCVDVFQSKWFEDKITSETWTLIQSGVGCLHWTRRRETLDESLALMRTEMLRSIRPSAALFVGGMEGILSEYEHCKELLPQTPKIPIAGPGGAAARLSMADARGLDLDEELIRSECYPFVAARVISAIASRSGADQ